MCCAHQITNSSTRATPTQLSQTKTTAMTVVLAVVAEAEVVVVAAVVVVVQTA
jgi:hypothetical protein